MGLIHKKLSKTTFYYNHFGRFYNNSNPNNIKYANGMKVLLNDFAFYIQTE